MSKSITAAEVRELLDYDAETGAFRWKPRRGLSYSNSWNGQYAGRPAGSMDSAGYQLIKIHARLYKAHRVAWLFVYGEWPEMEIDHIDCDRANNAIANLRVVTSRQNQLNRPSKISKSGFRGVWRHNKRWRSRICARGRIIDLGLFDTPEEARAAYEAAAVAHHGDSSVGAKPAVNVQQSKA